MVACSRKRFLAASLAFGVFCVLPVVAAVPRVEVVLDVAYGSGRAEVGVARSGNDCDCWVPVWPAMFQMTAYETLWVLDTVNSRVLAFRDGK